jgi:nitroreductase
LFKEENVFHAKVYNEIVQMQLNQVIEERTSVRRYLDKEIEDKQINEIIEAGIKAPSAKNLQPCKVFIVKNDKKLL